MRSAATYRIFGAGSRFRRRRRRADAEPAGDLGGRQPRSFCLVASHAAELDRGLLARLLSLPGELLLDVCGDETG